MNEDQFHGKWEQLKGSVKQQWGKLTNDDVTYIDGALYRLVGRVQERYGIQREQAEHLVKQWNGDGRAAHSGETATAPSRGAMSEPEPAYPNKKTGTDAMQGR